MRALLDTDIVLDYLLAREPFVYEATKIWDAAKNGEFEPFVSAITPVNLYYIARKLKGDADARATVRGLLAIAQIALTDHAALQRALTLNMKDYEDAVQTASARAVPLEAIVTRNVSDYEGADVPIFSPDEFLARLAAVNASNER